MKLFRKKEKKDKKSDSLSAVNSKRSTVTSVTETQSQRDDSSSDSDSDESVASTYSTASASKNRTARRSVTNKPKIHYNTGIAVRILEGKLLQARTDKRAAFDAFIAIKFDNQKRTTRYTIDLSCYVTSRVKKDDSGSVLWNDSAKLYLSDTMDIKHMSIEIALVEKDYLGDQVVGSFSYPVSNLTKGAKTEFFIGFSEKSESSNESGKFKQNEVRFQLFWEDLSQEEVEDLDMEDVLGVDTTVTRASRDHLSKRSTFVSASFQKQKEEDVEFEKKKVQVMTDHQDRVAAFEQDCQEIRKALEVREQQNIEREKELQARLEAVQKKMEDMDAKEAARKMKEEEKQRQHQEQQRKHEEDFRKSREIKLEGMSGLLAKQGHARKTWKNRYFVIKGPELHYYTQINETKLKGKINLKGGNVILDTDVDGRSFCFRVIPRDGKEYIISATSEDERSNWADAIRMVAFKYQERVNADTKKAS